MYIDEPARRVRRTCRYMEGKEKMSLRVWLPLTKDLRNQGLSNVTVTNNGATFNSAGKLGGCYKTSSTATIDLGYNGNQVNTGSISFGGWFNFNKAEIWSAISGKSYNTNANAATGCLIGNNSYGGVSLQWYTNNIYTSNSLTALYVQGYLRSSTNGARATSGFSLPFDAWVHIYFTFDKVSNIMTLYINGENKYTYTNVAFSDARNYNLFVNLASIAGGNGPAASIPFLVNDVRIYDHCLSPMEVKELAKGLILHYPLNRQGWGQENLASQYVMPGGKSPGTISTAGRTNYYGDYGITIPATENADTYFSIWYSEPLESGATYTLSAEVSGLLSGSYYYFPLFAQNNSSMGIIKFDHNGLNTLTFTMNYTSTIVTATYNGKTYYRMFMDDISRVIASGQGAITIKNIKLEKGSIATPWCPNSSDALATTMGLNGTTEYDCSGFCNNGTRTGTFSWTSDTPKYQVSTHIGSTSSKIHISNFPTSGFGNTYSFAWWGKRSSNGPMFWGFSDGIRLNGMYTGTLWNTGDGSNNPIYKPNTTTTITAPSINVWHHYVMTGDGTVCKLYVDGEFYGQAKTYKAISGTSIYINGWDSGTSYCSDNTDMSDFRIYATALSASDVKSLYQNCATIDPDGTIRGQIRS